MRTSVPIHVKGRVITSATYGDVTTAGSGYPRTDPPKHFTPPISYPVLRNSASSSTMSTTPPPPAPLGRLNSSNVLSQTPSSGTALVHKLRDPSKNTTSNGYHRLPSEYSPIEGDDVSVPTPAPMAPSVSLGISGAQSSGIALSRNPNQAHRAKNQDEERQVLNDSPDVEVHGVKYLFDPRRKEWIQVPIRLIVRHPNRGVGQCDVNVIFSVKVLLGTGPHATTMPMLAKMMRHGIDVSESDYFGEGRAHAMCEEFARGYEACITAALEAGGNPDHLPSLPLLTNRVVVRLDAGRLPESCQNQRKGFFSYRTTSREHLFVLEPDVAALDRLGWEFPPTAPSAGEEAVDPFSTYYPRAPLAWPKQKYMEVAEAFSHFTFTESKESILVHGIRRMNGFLCDAIVCTRDRYVFGVENGGVCILTWWRFKHKCNDTCRALGLTPTDTYTPAVRQDNERSPPTALRGQKVYTGNMGTDIAKYYKDYAGALCRGPTAVTSASQTLTSAICSDLIPTPPLEDSTNAKTLSLKVSRTPTPVKLPTSPVSPPPAATHQWGAVSPVTAALAEKTVAGGTANQKRPLLSRLETPGPQTPRSYNPSGGVIRKGNPRTPRDPLAATTGILLGRTNSTAEIQPDDTAGLAATTRMRTNSPGTSRVVSKRRVRGASADVVPEGRRLSSLKPNMPSTARLHVTKSHRSGVGHSTGVAMRRGSRAAPITAVAADQAHCKRETSNQRTRRRRGNRSNSRSATSLTNVAMLHTEMTDPHIAEETVEVKDAPFVFPATKYVYSIHSHSWEKSAIRVRICDPAKGVAQGGMRVCFEVREMDKNGERSVRNVAKMFRRTISEVVEEDYYTAALVQTLSTVFTRDFTRKVRTSTVATLSPTQRHLSSLEMISCCVVVMESAAIPLDLFAQRTGFFSYKTSDTHRIMFTMEPMLQGSFTKYNNNCGGSFRYNEHPLSAEASHKRIQIYEAAEALTHYSLIASSGGLLVCDIQGVGSKLTDPEVHTYDGEGLGIGNLGQRGISQFVLRHRCNNVCQAAGLEKLQSRPPQLTEEERSSNEYVSILNKIRQSPLKPA